VTLFLAAEPMSGANAMHNRARRDALVETYETRSPRSG